MPRTIVVKVGTSTLTDTEGRLDRSYLPGLAEQLCTLMDEGQQVVLVTSGAVRAGVEALGWDRRPRTVPLKQAAAAVGQGRLMALYAAEFEARGRTVAQVLLTRQLAQERSLYVNAQNTLTTLLRYGVLPIVNENDTVAVEELQFGDNDTLAALVAALVGAGLLILLTNVPGLLDANGELIPQVQAITPEVRALAGGPGTHGSGGMVTKLDAAEIAAAAGARTVIAHGRLPGVVLAAARGEPAGTAIGPGPRRLKGRKHWLAYGMERRGALHLHPRACLAVIREGKSLLPAGVTAVSGSFAAGEAVSLCSEGGREFGRGIAAYGADQVRRVLGMHSAAATRELGEGSAPEVVHRDNLVVLYPDVQDLPAGEGTG